MERSRSEKEEGKHCNGEKYRMKEIKYDTQQRTFILSTSGWNGNISFLLMNEFTKNNPKMFSYK